MSILPEFLSLPQIERVRCRTNFIKTAVCEVRFPTLLELEQREPAKVQKLLRKEYPFFEKSHSATVSEQEDKLDEKRYVFKSRKQDWIVSLRTSTLTLETIDYRDFEDFKKRFFNLMEATSEFLDTSFFTRVGLRFINAVPISDGTLDGWINPALISGFDETVLGPIGRCNAEIRGVTEYGGYTFRHGATRKDPKNTLIQEYTLDFDYYAEGVDFQDVLPLITKFNQINLMFFTWAIEKKAISTLGKVRPKK